jgi:CspA family cold shock protein
MTPTAAVNNQRPNLLGAAQVSRTNLVGVVRHLLYDRGFGFVEGSDGYDYFFHWTALNRKTKHFRNLKEGEKVTFDIEDDSRNRGFRVCSNSMMVNE